MGRAFDSSKPMHACIFYVAIQDYRDSTRIVVVYSYSGENYHNYMVH